jgi:hypothetical protein
VPDLDLRKQLIQKEREITDNSRYACMTDVPTARADLRTAAATARFWPLEAAVFAVLSVLAGAWLYQVPGAIAGATVAYFVGKTLEEKAKISRAAAVMAAEEKLREVEISTEKTLNEPYIFSSDEMRTGEPDPKV